MPQIDGLRAAAVTAVVVHHAVTTPWGLGGWGVTLFFVVSGYLITGSILALKSEGQSLGAAALNFFVRRSLRLFPAYYLVVLTAACAWPDVLHDIAWYLTYTSNFLLAIREDWIALTPTWSLSVEEQFYLVWFFVATLLPARGLKVAILGLIAIGPLARFWLLSQEAYFSLSVIAASADALAVGAGLCLLERSGAKFPVKGPAVLAVFVALLLAPFFVWKLNRYYGAIGQSALVMVCAYMVWRARHGFGGIAGLILTHPAAVWLGQISYGVYLYDMLVPRLLRESHLLDAIPLLRSGLGQFAIETGVTIIVASASYRYFEAPIRYGLLCRFENLRSKPADPMAAAEPDALQPDGQSQSSTNRR
jgi:peptidoglycan/LPS O-acetylase OafA/YrhL